MAGIRTFIALEMPVAVKRQVIFVARHLSHLGQMRWVRSEGVHLTLKFLGDVEENRVADIVSAVQQVASKFQPFALSTAGLGGFPRLESARVLWLGVEGDLEQLRILQGRIAQKLEDLGFERERRPFFAHVTVGRARRKPVRAIAENATKWRAVNFSVDRVSVMKSTLRPEGAVYTPLGYGMFEGRGSEYPGSDRQIVS